MATQLQIINKISGTLGSQNVNLNETSSPTWTGNGGIDTYFDIAIAAAGTLIDLSFYLTTPGVCAFQNIDAENFVEIGSQVSSVFYPLIKLEAGRVISGGDLAVTSIYARADTAPCKLRVFCLEK